MPFPVRISTAMAEIPISKITYKHCYREEHSLNGVY
jgi:hypothetical protein